MIIEYKRDKNFSVIDQGYAYLSLMLNNKADFIDLPIELWEITKYENHLIQYNKLKFQDSSESINIISKSSEVISKVVEEVKIYTEQNHLQSVGEVALSLYEELKNQILNLGNEIEVIPKKFIILKNHFYFCIKIKVINAGSGTEIRTPVNGTKTHRPTTRRSPNVLSITYEFIPVKLYLCQV